MGRAKIAIRGKAEKREEVPKEERWVIVGGAKSDFPGKLVYSLSETGMNREQAEAMSARLVADTEVVPYLALDRLQCYDKGLHDKFAAEIAERSEDEEP